MFQYHVEIELPDVWIMIFLNKRRRDNEYCLVLFFITGRRLQQIPRSEQVIDWICVTWHQPLRVTKSVAVHFAASRVFSRHYLCRWAFVWPWGAGDGLTAGAHCKKFLNREFSYFPGTETGKCQHFLGLTCFPSQKSVSLPGFQTPAIANFSALQISLILAWPGMYGWYGGGITVNVALRRTSV